MTERLIWCRSGIERGIDFGVEDDDDNYFVDWEDGKWLVYCREYGLGHGWEKWELGNRDHDRAYQALLHFYGLTENEMPLEKIVLIHPDVLRRLGRGCDLGGWILKEENPNTIDE